MSGVRIHDNESIAVFDPRCSTVGLARPWVVKYAPRNQQRFYETQCLSDKDIAAENGWHLVEKQNERQDHNVARV